LIKWSLVSNQTGIEQVVPGLSQLYFTQAQQSGGRFIGVITQALAIRDGD